MPLGIEAPVLVAGTSWTYKMTGPWAFHDEFVVVLAEAGPDGYLFAGATRDDLTQEILEGSVLLGRKDAQMNLVDDDGQVTHMAFSFPLTDGKTWRLGETAWSAVASQVRTPGGTEEGFRIVGANGDRLWEYTYAPSLGAVVTHTFTAGTRGALWTFELIETGEATVWTWFDYTFWTVLDGETKVVPYAVDEATDAVLFESYGAQTARGYAKPPSGQLREFQGKGADKWEVTVVDGEPGDWLLGSVVPPDTPYALWAIGVRWLDGSTG